MLNWVCRVLISHERASWPSNDSVVPHGGRKLREDSVARTAKRVDSRRSQQAMMQMKPEACIVSFAWHQKTGLGPHLASSETTPTSCPLPSVSSRMRIPQVVGVAATNLTMLEILVRWRRAKWSQIGCQRRSSWVTGIHPGACIVTNC